MEDCDYNMIGEEESGIAIYDLVSLLMMVTKDSAMVHVDLARRYWYYQKRRYVEQ